MSQNTLFQPVGSKDRLVDRVVGAIEQLIIEGKLQPKAKLPPERALAEQFGVSRTVMREAVQILVTKGLLQRRHGVGTTVRRLTSEQVAGPLNLLLRTRSGRDVSFADLHQVRSILEVETAGLAAEMATEEEIAHLRQITQAMEESVDAPEALAVHDADFHTALAEMTHNPLLVVLLNSVRDLLREYITMVTPYLDPRQDVLPSHRMLLQHVEAGDSHGARRAMRDHLIQMRKNHEKYAQMSKSQPQSNEESGP